MKRLYSMIAAFAVLAASAVQMDARTQNSRPDWKGKVVDENGAAMPYVNVVLLSMPDSLVLDGAITDEAGEFTVKSAQDKEILMAAMIGYKSSFVQRGNEALIRMEPESAMLGEASVKAFMPKTKLTGEGMNTTVKGTVLENIGSAKDALSRIPGVYNGRNGLEVIGRGTPLIYINGRKLLDVTELERLRSNEIQSVEVIENPGPRYDATVSCVIRIKTFRPQGEGISFNLGLTDQQSLDIKDFNDPNSYANFNYRKGGLDLFAWVNGKIEHTSQESVLLTETVKDPVMKQSGPLDSKSETAHFSVNAGMNYMLGNNHSMGFRAELSRSPRFKSTLSLEEDFWKGGSLVEHVMATTLYSLEEGNKPYSFSGNAYYNGTFAGKLNVDFNADYYGSSTVNLSSTTEKSSAVPDNAISSRNGATSDLYAAKLVLSYPVWRGSLQVGNEDTYSRRSSSYSISGVDIPASSTKVTESNMALFANYVCFLPVVGQLSAGVRYELVGFDYNDFINSANNLSRKYSNFFPTVSIAQAFGPVQLQLIYSMKTSRPSFQNLSDNLSYHSKFMLQSGNAKLQPQTTQQLSFTSRWNFITAILQYSRTDDAIVSWAAPYNDAGVVLAKPVNLVDPFRSLQWYLNFSPTIGIWTMNYTAGMMHQWLDVDMKQQAGFDGDKVVSFNDKPMFIAQAFNSLNFKNGWMMELGAEYHSRAYSQNVLLDNNYLNLTASVQKAFLKDKSLVLRLSANDLVKLANFDVVTDFGHLKVAQTNIFDNRRVTLSLTYRFNSAQSKYKGTGAGKEAASRM